jgi:transcriptional regulator GlxA family with amidase domain
MRTKARRVVVVVFDEVELLDVAAPLEVLSTAGRRWNFRPYKVEVAAQQAGLVSTRNQMRIEAATRLADAAPAEIVIVPGGYGARRFAEDASCIAELTRLASGAELIAGVGAGVLVLARAGLVADAKLATTPELAGALDGLVPSEQLDLVAPCMTSGRVISARASGAALQLGLTLIERTMGPKLLAMVASDLGVELEPEKPRLEVRY